MKINHFRRRKNIARDKIVCFRHTWTLNTRGRRKITIPKKGETSSWFFLSFFWSLWFGWGPPGDYPDVFGGLEVGELAAETGRAIWVSIAFPFEGFRSFVRASIYLSPALYRILQGLSSPSSAQHHGLLCPSRQNKQEETTQ